MVDNKQVSSTTPPEQSNKARLLDTFERLIPLVDGISDSIRFAVLLGAGLAIWVFVWLFMLNDFSAKTAGVIAGISLIPALILSRFWWALEELKGLPDIVTEMIDDAKEDVQETVQSFRNGNVKKAGLFGSVKSLLSIRSILSEAEDMLGSYISISALVNPFWLILGIFSLIAVMILVLVGAILAFLTLF